MKALSALVIAGALAGCAGSDFGNSMNDALTPSASVMKDDFDGSVIVRQRPVGATSSFTEPMYQLGFDWTQKTPDRAYFTVGMAGIQSVTGLAFNADGKVIEAVDASHTTDFDTRGTYAMTTSIRRFSVPWSDFVAIAKARSVKMKVSRVNDYGVSSFGPDNPNAVVNVKFAPFIEQVEKIRSTASIK